MDILSKDDSGPFDNPSGALILFDKKKDGPFRHCMVYRALNNNAIVDSYPLPKIDELFSRLQGDKYFSKFALCTRYF